MRLHPRILGVSLPHLPVKLIKDRYNREDPIPVPWKWKWSVGVLALSDAVDNDGDGNDNSDSNGNDIDLASLTCAECSHKFFDLGTYNRHIKTNKSCKRKRKRNNEDDKSASKKSRVECNICSSSFSSLSSLNKHK